MTYEVNGGTVLFLRAERSPVAWVRIEDVTAAYDYNGSATEVLVADSGRTVLPVPFDVFLAAHAECLRQREVEAQRTRDEMIEQIMENAKEAGMLRVVIDGNTVAFDDAGD